MKNNKKIIAIILILLIATALFSGCKKDEPVTLESMKKALTDAGYTVENDLVDAMFAIWYENSIGGFTFIYPGAHGETIIPVIEYRDKAAADEFAKIVNDTGSQAIANNNFVVLYDNDGHNHDNEITFIENLLNGKPIK
jgi:hypothetical protein